MATNGNPLVDHLDLWTSALLSKSTAGRGSNGKREAYGIKKLRELILELAVRGKLVPQDPNDEPASKLLQRIASEKARLVREGKIRRPKPVSDVSDDEAIFQLPMGWTWARLEQLAPMSLFDGDWIESKDQDLDGSIRLIQLADIGVDEFKDVSEKFINDETFEKLSCTELHQGDILIARLPSPIGRACIFPGLTHRAVTAVDVAIFRLLDFALDRYIVHSINSAAFRNQVEEFGKGATRFRISTGNLKTILVPVPPRAEQHRIVAKVDELMALCDQLEQQQNHSTEAHQTLVETLLRTLTQTPVRAEPVEARPSTVRQAHGSGRTAQGLAQTEFDEAWNRIAAHFDTLFTTEHSIDQLKQTILQLAVMGKLVPQDPNDEPAGLLLERIARQKQAMLEAKQFRQGKVSRPQTAIDAPAVLPSGWRWVNVDALCFKVTDGTHFTPQYVESGVRFVSAKDIVDGVLTFDRCKFITQEEHEQLYRRCNPEYHDIVISKSGSIGSVALIEDRGEFSLFESLALLKFDQKSLLPQYLVYALVHACASLTIGHIRGVGVKHLHLDMLRGLEFPLPPLAEQHRIVAKVDELMALCDSLKARIKDAQTTQVHLADAIVEQAVA